MKVAFRADASSDIGLGHLMRCLTLAAELQRRGHGVRFICRRLPGDGTVMLDRAGIEVDWLPEPGRAPTGREPWNLVAPDVDAEQTRRVLGEVDWLVVDHYGLDDRWETSMRSRASRLLVIDDLPDRARTMPMSSSIRTWRRLIGGLSCPRGLTSFSVRTTPSFVPSSRLPIGRGPSATRPNLGCWCSSAAVGID